MCVHFIHSQINLAAPSATAAASAAAAGIASVSHFDSSSSSSSSSAASTAASSGDKTTGNESAPSLFYDPRAPRPRAGRARPGLQFFEPGTFVAQV